MIMCTVTFIPKGKTDFVLTSSRDEAVGRKTLPPEFYLVDGVKMLFPKDAVAGGTWIGISDLNRMVCLLNGGFTSHIRKEKYRMSRGVVVKKLLAAENLLETLREFNYTGIEPFTIVALDWSQDLKLYEMVWDGKETHLEFLPLESKIWSSSSLYDEDMKHSRNQWFENFKLKETLDSESLMKFHKTGGEGNPHSAIKMDRGFVKTVSITQILKENGSCSFKYLDLQENSVYTSHLDMTPV